MENQMAEIQRLGDFFLVALRWEDDGTTLEIHLRCELNQTVRERVIVCRYYQNLRIDFDLGKLCDNPLMWGSTLSTTPSGYELLLDFRGSSNGLIRLEASTVELR